MNLDYLIQLLKSKDITLSLDDSQANLRLLGNVANLTPEDKHYLINNKQAIIASLLNSEVSSALYEPLTEPDSSAIDYWLELLSDPLPVADLFYLKTGKSNNNYSKRHIYHKYDGEFYLNIEKFATENRISVFSCLLFGLKTLLFRYGGQEDFIVAVQSESASDTSSNTNMFFTKTVLTGEERFLDLIIREDTVLKEMERFPVPHQQLINKIQERSTKDCTDSLFNIKVSIDLSEQQNHVVSESADGPYFDIDFVFKKTADAIELHIYYNSASLDNYLVERIFRHYECLWMSVLEEPFEALVDLNLLPNKEKEKVLFEFNLTNDELFEEKTIIDLFEEQVEKTPSNIAVAFMDQEITYRRLDEQANQFCHFLKGRFGLDNESLVGIKVARSEKMIIAILAVLKAGAAYVPIDVGYPQERIAYIESDINASVIIDEDELGRFYQEAYQLPVTRPERNSTGNSLAYVIYTSGTTGHPKGVMVENRSVVSISECWRKQYHLEDFEVNLLQLASISFDVFVGDLCRSLLLGGKMVICPSDLRLHPAGLYELMKQHSISILEGTPALLMTLVNYVVKNQLDYRFLKVIIFGSDSFGNQEYNAIKKSIGQHVRVINSYGVTEATIDSTYFDGLIDEFWGTTPIGKPFANSKIYILSSLKSISPAGTYGKLYISGAGLARAYLNNDLLTQEKFIENPFLPDSRMYDTGDIARWLPDGNIEFGGRKDYQVKIRGYRIELGEIETTLLQFSDVIKQAVVDAKEVNGEKSLIAYYVAAQKIDKSGLRNYLLEKLPEYMVPGFYVFLDSLPLTPNGKVDRRALPQVTSHDIIQRGAFSSANELEQKLLEVYAGILLLDIGQIGIESNFFEIGGTSLSIIKLVNEINNVLANETTVELSPVTIFEYPSIKALAEYLKSGNNNHALEESINESIGVLNETLDLITQIDE